MDFVTKNKELNMQHLRPLLNSIFHPSASAGTSVSSDIAFIGSPYKNDYATKINDWLTTKGLALKPNQCNLPKVLGDIQSTLNGISRDEPRSVLPLDISKAIQLRLKTWGIDIVQQNDTLFNTDTKDITYSWTVVHKKGNIVMSINLPTDSYSGVGGCGIVRDKAVDKILSEIDVFITQITSLCNLMDKQLFIPERVEFEGNVISLGEFINQIQVDIKSKMESVNGIKQGYISSYNQKKEAPDCLSDEICEMMGLENDCLSLKRMIGSIEGGQGLQMEKINKVYGKLQQHGFKIQNFFPQMPVPGDFRMAHDVLTRRGISGDELEHQLEMNISVAK